LTTPTFSTIGLSSAVLVFNEAYDLRAGTTAKVEISTDGGTTYTTLKTYTGPAFLGPTNGMTFLEIIDLNAYLGRSNLKIRFNYFGSANSVWAIDNVVVTNSIANPTGVNVYNTLTYAWSPSTDLSATSGQSVTFTPTAANGIGVKTINLATSSGGCAATNTSVNVTVNDPVAITTQPATTSFCQGSNATITVVATGTSPTYQWQTSTDGGTTWGNVTNIAPYSGATTATLSFTNPAITLSSNLYRVII